MTNVARKITSLSPSRREPKEKPRDRQRSNVVCGDKESDSDDPDVTHMKNTKTTLVLFNNSELKPLGTVQPQTRNPKNGESYLIEYTVVSNGLKALLSVQSIQQFSFYVRILTTFMCVYLAFFNVYCPARLCHLLYEPWKDLGRFAVDCS